MNTNTELWICADCRVLVETGESSAHAEGAKPLALIPETTTLAFAGEDTNDDASIDYESAERCQGCDSKLAGVRFRYVTI